MVVSEEYLMNKDLDQNNHLVDLNDLMNKVEMVD